MKMWKTAAVVAIAVAAAGAGAALAPAAHGQTRPRLVKAQSNRAIEVFTGGSRIGVSIREVEESDAKSAKGATAGVVVEDVSTDSPASKAGIRKGDVLVEFDGEKVRSVRQLTRLVQETPAGRSVNAVLARDGQRTTVTVTPGESSRYPFDFDSFGDVRDMAQNFRY